MGTKTLLHLHYLNRVFILVNQENYDDYSLHAKVGNQIERKVFKEIDGNAKERLAAYLITMERYHLFLEKEETKRSEEAIKWDESYLQLVQFIDSLIPGYIFHLAYLQRETLKKEEAQWVSTYMAYEVHHNQLKEKKPAFTLLHEKGEQQVQWVMPKEYLIKHYPDFQNTFQKIKEEEFLVYKHETNPILPNLFEGFDDLLE